MTRTLIIAPPPTPNGGLHVGHLSGPYLGADICKRLLAVNDCRAVYTISTDDNQSYVSTTAARLGVPAGELMAQARRDVAQTLRDYHLDVDLFGAQDDAYVAYVEKGFATLMQTGRLRWQTVDVLFDRRSASYPVESHVSGTCPECYAATCGGICEACGHANNVIEIVDPRDARYEVRQEPRLVFDIEHFRPALREVLAACALRPYLRNLVEQYLAKPIAPFVMSYKTGRGIGTACCGEDGQWLNVWGEMLFGHRYFLEAAAGEVDAGDRYVQFLGFDNSYFYVILHTAMSLALREQGDVWPLPCAFITNQFYNLEAEKFSTSKGHLIWANTLSTQYNTDLIRLYLALNGPELQEADFVEDVFAKAGARLAAKFNRLADLYNRHGDEPCDVERHAQLVRPYAFDAERYTDFMIGRAARKAVNVMTLLVTRIESGVTDIAGMAPALIENLISPFCPAYAQACRIALAQRKPLPRMAIK